MAKEVLEPNDKREAQPARSCFLDDIDNGNRATVLFERFCDDIAMVALPIVISHPELESPLGRPTDRSSYGHTRVVRRSPSPATDRSASRRSPACHSRAREA